VAGFCVPACLAPALPSTLLLDVAFALLLLLSLPSSPSAECLPPTSLACCAFSHAWRHLALCSLPCLPITFGSLVPYLCVWVLASRGNHLFIACNNRNVVSGEWVDVWQAVEWRRRCCHRVLHFCGMRLRTLLRRSVPAISHAEHLRLYSAVLSGYCFFSKPSSTSILSSEGAVAFTARQA